MTKRMVLSLLLLSVFPAVALSAGTLTEEVQTAITGTTGSDVIDNTTPRAASADIDTGSDDNVLTRATGIDALAGTDQVGNTAAITVQSNSRIDMPMKYGSTAAEARTTGIAGGSGGDGITNSGLITVRSIVDSIIGNFILTATDIGITGMPTESTGDATAIDGGAGLDTVTNTGPIDVYVEADSTVSQGTVSAIAEPVDAFSLGDARTEATSTAAGIRGGDLYTTEGPRESLTNIGLMTVYSKATSTADKFIVEAAGAARVDGSTTADAGAIGVDGGSQSNTIINRSTMSVTAEAEAGFATTQLKMKGLMAKALLDLFGLDVGKAVTTATADAVGADGGDGDDDITNAEAAGMMDVYGKATADSQEVTVSISLSTSGGAEMPVAGTPAARGLAAAQGGESAEGEAYADAGTVSTATAVGMSGGSGVDTITNDAPLRARTESFASSTGTNIDVSLAKESSSPLPGAAVASTSTGAGAASTGIDGGDGDDTIINTAALDAVSYAESDAKTVGAVFKGSLEGLAAGVTVVDSSSGALAQSRGVAGGSGDDTVINEGVVTSLATSISDSDSVGVTAAGGKVGMAFGVALGDASTTASAYSHGIDLGGEETRTSGIGKDTVDNYGTVDTDAISTSSGMSVAVTFSAELEGVVGGVSAARGDGVAEAFVTGVRTGAGGDSIVNAGDGFLSADSSATSTTDTVAVNVSAAWKGVALGAALADATTTATAEAAGIESGAGNDTINTSKSLVSSATADARSDVITVDFSVAAKGFSAGVAISNTETNADATAEGIGAGEGNDGVTNTSSVDVDATARTAIKDITINFSSVGAVIADASSNATSVATGFDGGAGTDTLSNAGALDVTATSTVIDTGAAANLTGFAQGDVTTTATATATGIRGGGAEDESVGDTVKNDHDGSVVVTSSANINADSYVVQGGGVTFADTGGRGYSYATGIAGDTCIDKIRNYGLVDVTAETNLRAVGFNFQLVGVQLGAAGLNTVGTAAGIDAGAGRNEVTNGSTGVVKAFADVETLAGSVISGFSAGVVSAGTTADIISRGISTGGDKDIIKNHGIIDVTGGALGQAGAGAIGLLAASAANSISSGVIEGINSGGGDDEITNGTTGIINVGTVADGNTALVKSDTEAVAYDLFSFVMSTLGARAEVSAIKGGAGEDTITNNGRITAGDDDDWMVVGESLGAAGQIAGADSVYAGTMVAANASGIDGGSDDDGITNDSYGSIQVDARGYADVETYGYVLTGLFLPLRAESSAEGTASATGIRGGTGTDTIDNFGAIASSSYMLSDAYSSSDMPGGIESSPYAESHGKAQAYSVGVDLGSGINTFLNSGYLIGRSTALTRSHAISDSNTLRTYGEAHAMSISDAAGVAGGDEGDTVTNDKKGTIAAEATARTDDLAGNVTKVVSDEEATAIGGVWGGSSRGWLPVTANAAGISLGSGDDTVVNDGAITATGVVDVSTYAYSKSTIRHAWSKARSVGSATATGIAGGAGEDSVTNNALITSTAVAHAYPKSYSWSRDHSSSTESVAGSTAVAKGIEADGTITNSADGDIGVTARGTSYAYSNTESEESKATTDIVADATGIATTESQRSAALRHLILNDGGITVTATAGENASGNVSEMAYVFTELNIHNALAQVDGTATARATGIDALNGPADITNNGTLMVESRSRPYARAYADLYQDNPTAKAYSTGVAQATGISAVSGDNNVYNHKVIEVNAKILNAYSRGDTYSSWSGCVSLAETDSTATAAGIITADGNDEIGNYATLRVKAEANAESYAWADTRDNNLASEDETTTARADAFATGVDAGVGVNTVYNTGTLEVEARATAVAGAGGGHASVHASSNADATAVGITAGDGGSTVTNTGSLDVRAIAGGIAVTDANAVGILTGAGDDTIINEGVLFTDTFTYVLVPLYGDHDPGLAVDSGAGHDTVSLLGGSESTGHIVLGPGDDALEFYGDAVLTGGADGGEGNDVLLLDGAGSATGTLSRFETTLKLGTETFTVAAFPQSGLLEVRNGALSLTQAAAMYSGGVFKPTVYGDGACGSVLAAGLVTLDGGLEVVKNHGLYFDGTTYGILTATGIAGDFNSTVLPEPTALVSFGLNRSPDSLQIVANVKDFVTQARTPNQAALARRLDRLTPSASGDLSILLAEFQSLGESEFREAFHSLSPESHDNSTAATVGLAQQAGSVLQRRMGSIRAGVIAARESNDKERIAAMLAYSGSIASLGTVPAVKERQASTPYGVWLEGFGHRADQSSSASFTGYDVRTGGLIGGFDHSVGENVVAGASIHYSSSSLDMDQNSGHSTVENAGGSLYGTYFTERSHLDASLSYSCQQYDQDRKVLVGGIARKAKSEHEGDAFSVSVGGGHDFTRGAWRVGPFGALRYVFLRENGFTESGAGAANLALSGRDTDSLASELGVRLGRVFKRENTIFVPELSVAWLHDFGIDDRMVTAAFAGTPRSSFSVRGQQAEKNGVSVRLGATVLDDGGLSLAVNYSGEFRDDYSAHGGAAEIRFDF